MSAFPLAWVDQIPDVGQVVVIVLRHKVQMVHQSHGCFQSGMKERAGAGSKVDPLDLTHQPRACAPEFGQYLADRALVVLRLVRLLVAQVSRCKTCRFR